jgi:iron complex transport system substrate-binding protein
MAEIGRQRFRFPGAPASSREIVFGRALVLIAGVLLVGAPLRAERVLQDELGRTVRLPDHPQRIVCLAPSLTETVYALGLGSTVVGVTDFTDYPQEARTKPSVGGLDDASVEKIISLHPDLVLSLSVINREETVNELDRVGIPVFVVNPRGMQGILESVQHVGDALNRPDDAARLVNHLEGERAWVAVHVAKSPRPKVLVVIWYDPVVTAGRGSYITDVISAAGAQSATADLAQAWPQISLEEVIRRAPDFLLLVRGAGGMTDQELKTHAGWDQLRAVRDNRVIYLDERLLRPSPVVFEVLKQLAKELHPGAF